MEGDILIREVQCSWMFEVQRGVPGRGHRPVYFTSNYKTRYLIPNIAQAMETVWCKSRIRGSKQH